jgi:hypothetical protein
MNMIRRTGFLGTAFIALSPQTWAAEFDRPAFLAAVKERFKSETRLMNLGSVYDPILRIESYPAKTEGWQKDLIRIPGLSLPPIGDNATFGIALAHLASRELGIPFSSRRGDALVDLVGRDDAHLSVEIDTRLTSFGNILLQAVFDEKHPCTIQYALFRGTQFLNEPVIVNGTLFHANTVHHRTIVLLEVGSMERTTRP